MPTLFVRYVSSVRIAVCAALITAGCAHRPDEPQAPVADGVPAAAPAHVRNLGAPTSVATVLEVYRTQPVERGTRERCGQQIAPPPKPGWFSSAPSAEDVKMPPPVFVPEMACDEVAAQRYKPAHYRVAYRFDDEVHLVDVDFDPGGALSLDDMGQVLGPAPQP